MTKKPMFTKKRVEKNQRTIRIPVEVEERLAEEASRCGVSVPAAIIQVLERWAESLEKVKAKK